MARMAGLWSFTCVLPEDHDEWGDSEETEQPGTSYDSRSSAFSYTSSGKSKDSRRSGEFDRGGRDHHRSGNCYSGGAHMLACFRAGAINLIVHPALQMTTSTGPPSRPGASTVQPVNSLPRASFLDGAAAEDSGDEPTSPVVTCIGQVRKDKPRTPPKPVVAEVVGGDLMRLKSTKREKPLPRFESSTSPSSPSRPSKWRQILGGRRTTSVQQPRDEYHVDLNRFSSACSTVAKMDVKAARRTGTGAFLAKSLMMLQMERGDNDDYDDGKLANQASCQGTTTDMMLSSEQASWHDKKTGAIASSTMVSKGGGGDEVLLWKRRSGAKPLMLDVKRRLN